MRQLPIIRWIHRSRCKKVANNISYNHGRLVRVYRHDAAGIYSRADQLVATKTGAATPYLLYRRVLNNNNRLTFTQ
jgi:hypothetical protein